MGQCPNQPAEAALSTAIVVVILMTPALPEKVASVQADIFLTT